MFRSVFPPNGDGEIRTHDPLLARQVLSQLSYTPRFYINWFVFFLIILAATYSPMPSPT